jgi:Tfp pilus assembly protein PilP
MKKNIIYKQSIWLVLFLAVMISPFAIAGAKEISPDSALLNYVPINFKEVLSKPKMTSISTERDPFMSPFYVKTDGTVEGIHNTAFNLTGIIKGPDGYVALISPVSGGTSHSIRQGDRIANFYVKKITDDEVILNINGNDTLLKLRR